jgi:acyl dehydratase/NAD(P)-dependent dehydrogenase (short-subunit alcohol dehydrogenase family)
VIDHGVISLDQSHAFARLSGDSNPLHLDPVWARRLQFGECVVHGVNLTLIMLEEIFRVYPVPAGHQLAELSVQYDSALRVGEPLKIVVENSDDGNIKATAFSVKRVVQRLFVRLEALSVPEIAIGEQNPGSPPCEDVDFDGMMGARGEAVLTFDSNLARRLFPVVNGTLPRAQIAVLLASTMIVGMRIPGLHSVFASLCLCFSDARRSSDLRYRVVKADPRFNLIIIDLDGGGAFGSLSALVRPQPVLQMDYLTVKERTLRRAFTARRVLVVGGSRGIGEATAKIAAASGGTVTITYSTGRADAVRVAEEIRAGGGQCSVAHLDVRVELMGQLQQLLCDGAPDDIFYFASPVIDVSKSATWRPLLFQRYVEFYITAFRVLVDQIVSTRPNRAMGLNIFYPSTAFLDCPPAWAFEYCAAKAAGESICRGLAASQTGVSVIYPRIPQLLTDQTAAVRFPVPQSPADYMLSCLADWRSVSG